MKFMRLYPWVGSLLTAITIHVAAAWAGPIQEVLLYNGNPDRSQVEKWNRSRAPGDFLVRPTPLVERDLNPLLSLRFARLRIQLREYPQARLLGAWSSLAERGSELVMLDAGYPSDEQIDLLNRIGFKRVVLVVSHFPAVQDAIRLGRLRSALHLTFVGAHYPKYHERPQFEALPRDTELLFVTDYWPRYQQMDVLNLIPQRYKLRILDSYPSPTSLPYFLNLKRLTELQVHNDFAPADRELWRNLGGTPIRWSLREVPTQAALAQFEASQSAGSPRTLVLDFDRELSESERARLESSALPIEWVHQAR